MPKLKLGPKASQFYCPKTRVVVPKNEIVEVKTLSDFMKNRIKGGHLILVKDEKSEQAAIDKAKAEIAKKDPLHGHTMKEIIYQDFPYFEEDDVETLKKCGTKKELIEKARELDKSYDKE